MLTERLPVIYTFLISQYASFDSWKMEIAFLTIERLRKLERKNCTTLVQTAVAS
jgi:hypothetical protein